MMVGKRKLRSSEKLSEATPPNEAKKQKTASSNRDAKKVVTSPIYVIEEIEEIVEHICGRCERTFHSMKELKAHLPDCRNCINITQSLAKKADQPKGEQLIFSLEIPGDPPQRRSKGGKEQVEIQEAEDQDVFPENVEIWENHDDESKCFCCGEAVELSHAGHVKCSKCPKQFHTEEALSRHRFILHSQNPEFPCEKCNAFCASAAFLDLHMKAHSLGKPFCCKTCGKDFTRKYHLNRHLQYLNCGEDKPVVKHVCDTCKMSFTRQDNLKEHMLQHTNPSRKSKDFQCPYCPKAFAASSLLNIHIRTHTGEKPFICDICKNGFPSNAALRKHRRKHTGEKPYKCEHCGDCFAARETLNRHTKRHTGEMKSACPHCPAKFIQNSQLKNHMKVHDSSVTFDCKECGAKCKTTRALAIHTRNEHNIGVTYPCSFCSKVFVTKSENARHELGVHLQQRDFECQTCGKAFVTNTQLRVHSAVHSNEPPVRCKLCQKIIARKDNYRRHMKSAHKEEYLQMIEKAEARKLQQTPAAAPTEEADVEVLAEFEIVEIDEFVEEQERRELDGLAEQIQKMEVESSVSDERLKELTSEVLEALLDSSTLTEFDFSNVAIGEVLISIIVSAGETPFKEEGADEGTELRENIKMFLSLVMEDKTIQALLNNHPVDEVVQYLLKYLKADYKR